MIIIPYLVTYFQCFAMIIAILFHFYFNRNFSSVQSRLKRNNGRQISMLEPYKKLRRLPLKAAANQFSRRLISRRRQPQTGCFQFNALTADFSFSICSLDRFSTSLLLIPVELSSIRIIFVSGLVIVLCHRDLGIL